MPETLQGRCVKGKGGWPADRDAQRASGLHWLTNSQERRNDARYFVDIMRDGQAGALQPAEAEAVRADNAIAPDVSNSDDLATWHTVWSEEARSIVRAILRHRRAGNRHDAKAVRCLLPERLEWRRWTATLTERDRRRIVEAEALAAKA